MDRRDFLKIASCAGLTVAAPTAFGGPGLAGKPRKSYDPYSGLLFISINASGGWDPTSLCDPKGAKSENDPNPMNASYLTAEIGEAGAIRYAPLPFPASGLFGMNLDPAMYPLTMQAFFEKHGPRMTVINGIDVETNGHDQGSRNTWSGRLAEGHPTLAAFMAGALGREQPMAFLAFGGYAETAGVVARTRAGNTNVLAQLAYPQRIDPQTEESGFHHAKVQEMIDAAQAGRDQALMEAQGLPKIKSAISTLFTARSGSNELKRLQEYLPETLESGLRGQAQLAIAAYRAGICISANLDTGGFDTHGDHDNQQIPRLLDIIDGVDYLMDEAERQGVADKVIVAVGSDFGRTPYYNGGMGKDHWSTTSMLFLGAGIPGNRVVGSTDEEHNAIGVTGSLDPDTSSGARKIHPADIHYALRRVANLHDGELAAMFPLDLKGDPLPLFG
ncbi:MAG TPA: DUF1501 domain-containing protein [Nannocystaceae bacterium]|nr:DUF1501 domain-containing protein [Nannocystaceae bacterium]